MLNDEDWSTEYTSFFTLFDSISNFVIFINEKGKILFSNTTFNIYSGYSKEELKNNNFKIVLSETSSELFDMTIKSELEKNQSWKGELEHIRRDGSKFWTSSSISYIKNKNGLFLGYFIIENDISQLKEITTQLEYKASLLYDEKLKIETIVNNIPFSILVIEEDGTILFENEIFKTNFKSEFNNELLINSNINDYQTNVLIESIKILMTSKENHDMMINLKSNVHLQINIIPLKFDENDYIFIIVIRDVTKLIEFDLLQKQFVTSVSHELRTPIASILLSINNYISYMGKLSEEENASLLQFNQQIANVLKNMVEDLLIISHIDNKKLRLRNWIKLNIYNQINQVTLQLKPQIDIKNINVILNCENPLFLNSDEERLNQIIRIPFENAIKYSSKDSTIIICCSQSKIDNQKPEAKSRVSITIIDQGIGIQSSEQKFLFKRFFRGSNVQNIQGTGIGLSILKELIDILRGEILIESQENKGTKVTIILPNLEKSPDRSV